MQIDPIFRIPRIWSNKELKKFSSIFTGEVINVSGWRDEDKEGLLYKNYFSGACRYWVSNYNSEMKGYTGFLENEFFLDLTKEIDNNLHYSFDVAFSHTVFEHIFEIDCAFRNFCMLTKDIAIIVVPFLQEEHSDYGDYWRFTPQAVDKLFEKNGMSTLYINFNRNRNASIYVFAIASRNSTKWRCISQDKDNKIASIYDASHASRPGQGVISKPLFLRFLRKLKKGY